MQTPRWILLTLLTTTSVHVAANSPDHPADAPEAALRVGGGVIEVEFAPGRLSVTRAEVLQWIDTAACAVSRYYGRLPVPRIHVLVSPRAGAAGVHGTTYGGAGRTFIRIALGEGLTWAALKGNWVMTHELVHAAFPRVAHAHHWIEEGLATYVEPIARAQIGDLDPEQVWRETVRYMPLGEPRPGDRGLDHTPTWARTYWGGALFCLQADVQIREETGNRYGLQDALKGILAAGGNIEGRWPLMKALRVADQAVGVHVLTDLYRRMKDKPVAVDLPALWKQLGIVYRDGRVRFDDAAPLAGVRRSIIGRDGPATAATHPVMPTSAGASIGSPKTLGRYPESARQCCGHRGSSCSY